MSDRRGMNTNVTPSSVSAAIWNVRLLPPPVGIRAITFLPDFVAFITSS